MLERYLYLIYICISIHFWVSPYVYYILYSQYIEVSWNGDTQKCMVYDGKTDLYMDDLRVPPFQEISIYVHVYIYIWLTDVYIHNMYLHNIYTCMCFLLFNGYISVKGSLNLENRCLSVVPQSQPSKCENTTWGFSVPVIADMWPCRRAPISQLIQLNSPSPRKGHPNCTPVMADETMKLPSISPNKKLQHFLPDLGAESWNL